MFEFFPVERYDVVQNNFAGGFNTFQVNATNGQMGQPDVAVFSGNTAFVVTWLDDTNDVVRARVYNSAGVAQTGEITVGAAGAAANNSLHRQAVTTLANGSFVVGWFTNGANSDGSGSAVKAGIFTQAGVQVGAEIVVNGNTAGDQNLPDVVSLKSGGFALVFADASSGNADVKIKLFNSTGTAIGTELVVHTNNTNINFAQTSPSVTELVDGRLVVVWMDTGPTSGGNPKIMQAILDPRDGVVTRTTGTIGQTLYENNSNSDHLTGGASA